MVPLFCLLPSLFVLTLLFCHFASRKKFKLDDENGQPKNPKKAAEMAQANEDEEDVDVDDNDDDEEYNSWMAGAMMEV